MDDLKIGICWIMFMETGLIDLIELAARNDFPTLSVSPKQYVDCLESGETPASLKRRLGDAGVKVAFIDAIVTGLPGLGEPVPPTDAATSFRAADGLEALVVNAAHYRGQPVAKTELVDGVGQMAREAARHGLTLALEPIARSAFPDLLATQAIVEACGEANCGLTFDPIHWSRAGSTVADITALKPGVIKAFQLCDRTIPPASVEEEPMASRDLPGEGELPLWEVTDAVLANNPSLTIELEVLSRELQNMPPPQAAARSASAINQWLSSREN